jgi:hypothetical protein
MKILDLPNYFRPKTSIVYPPFKNGKYMEEYFYDFVMKHRPQIENYIYIPIFWTNIQTHPSFLQKKATYAQALKEALKKHPQDTQYFTIVQHDDGPALLLPTNTIIFGACTGTIPLPLIYEDIEEKLLHIPRKEKLLLASFVGTYTHPLREKLLTIKTPDIHLSHRAPWTNSVSQNSAQEFIEKTLLSKFCIAPRGYGRSSFRFFEAMLLDTPPIYVWDDIEWLPYKEFLDYSEFSISIQEKDIPNIKKILESISDETYTSMVQKIKEVHKWFTLDGMSQYVLSRLSRP